MSTSCLPPIRPYHPTTFLERGVSVPFTTPLLSGTRARPAEKQGLELVIPNPSGGRGVYITAWTGISSLCSPTLHDSQLNERIAALSSVTPSTIRRVAREVAAEGLAGEEAMKAALNSADQDRGDRLVANYLLLMALVEQVNTTLGIAKTGGSPDPADLQRRARLAVNRVAPGLGRSTNWVATALEAIADAMAGIGISDSSTTSRVPRLLHLLRQCSTAVSAWSATQHSEDQAAYAEMVSTVAAFTVSLAETTLIQARNLTKDVVGLLRCWSTDPVAVVRLVARPEWLLDGWEQICQLWTLAKDDAERRAALVEMVQMVPVLPVEAREWADLVIEEEVSMRLRRLIPLNEDWRTGVTVFNLVARNEKMRALTYSHGAEVLTP